jgi:hypothetical protein
MDPDGYMGKFGRSDIRIGEYYILNINRVIGTARAQEAPGSGGFGPMDLGNRDPPAPMDRINMI